MELRNSTDKTFTDISSEEYRVYQFATRTVRVDAPAYLHVSENGHRLLDGAGISHYIPTGWLHLSWKAKEDSPHFVK